MSFFQDFIVTNIFPDIKANNSDPDDQILELYSRIVHESARLVACWMSVGFAHGVLNTDNLSLKSITIDYGPFGFLDSYDPYFIPNHSDDSGRYDYESQPEIVRWNLKKLLQSLLPILSGNLNFLKIIYKLIFITLILLKQPQNLKKIAFRRSSDYIQKSIVGNGQSCFAKNLVSLFTLQT